MYRKKRICVSTNFFSIKDDKEQKLQTIINEVKNGRLFKRDGDNKFKFKADGSVVEFDKDKKIIKQLQDVITDDEVVVMKEYDINDCDVHGLVVAINSKKVSAYSTDDLVLMAQKDVRVRAINI